MTTTAKRLFDAQQLTAAAATYYTAPGLTNTIIKKLTFTNVDTVARAVTVYLIKLGGAASAANTLISARSLSPGETFECFEAQGHVLNAGDFIQAFASAAAAVTIQGSGVEVV